MNKLSKEKNLQKRKTQERKVKLYFIDVNGNGNEVTHSMSSKRIRIGWESPTVDGFCVYWVANRRTT